MENKIENIELLTAVFGRFPAFHDAEVLQIILKREDSGERCPTLQASFRVLQFNSLTENQDKRLLKNVFLVDLKFTHIFGLKLENYNHQNVLGNLHIAEFSNDYWESIRHDSRLLGVVSQQEIERLNFHVKFEYSFGVEAEFLCDGIAVISAVLIAD